MITTEMTGLSPALETQGVPSQAMPLLKTAVHPTGERLVFDADAHAYTVNDEKFTSVTTLLHSFFPQFDAESVAQKKALREGVSPESLLAAWAAARDEASRFGSMVHLMAETIIKEQNMKAADHLPQTERERSYLTGLKKSIFRIKQNFDFVEVEKIVFSPQRKIAGTIDILLRNKQTGSFLVADWKTNKEIKQQSFNNEMGFGPCKNLMNCNYIHYSLQLSVYRELLVNEGYLPAEAKVGLAIIHLKGNLESSSFDHVHPQDLGVVAREILNQCPPKT